MTLIESERLCLRQLVADDAPFILELLTDADFRANVGERGVSDLDSARRYIAQGPLASYAKFGFGLYAIEARADGVPLGLCGLLRRDSHPDVEIGFALLPRARGRGIALEAARATLAHAVAALGLRRIVAITAPHNSASIRILTRLGFSECGRGCYTGDGRESRLFAFSATAGPLNGG